MKKLIVLILLVMSMQIAYSKWEKCPGWKNEPYHNYSSMYIANNTIYLVFNYKNILISKDEAVNWELVPTAMDSIKSIMIKDGNIWIGTNKGVFVSKDEGKTWEEKNNGLTDLSITAIEQLNGNILIATKGHFYVSEDEGESWSERNSEIPNDLVINKIKISRDNNLYLATSSGIYYSANNGNNWELIGFKDSVVNDMFFYNKTIYAMSSFPYYFIYKSQNNGLTWDFIMRTPAISLFIDNQKMFVGLYGNGLIFSSDEKSWERDSVNLDNEFLENKVKTYNLISIQQLSKINNKLIAATNNGIFVSTDEGKNWEVSRKRENYGNVYSLYQYKNILLAGTHYLNNSGTYSSTGYLFMSTDYGNSWIKISNDTLIYKVRTMVISGDTLFVGTYYDGILYTTDYGKEWRRLNIQDNLADKSNIKSIYSILVKNDTLIVATYAGLYLSKDRGLSWDRWYLNGAGYSVFSIVNKGEEYFASTSFVYQKAIFKTKGIGNEWIDLSKGFDIPFQSGQLTAGYVKSLFVNNEDIYALVTGSIKTDGVYLSEDDGETWINKAVDKNERSLIINGLSIFVKNDNIFIGTDHDGIFVSTDNGTTWSEFRDNKKNDGIASQVTTGFPFAITAITNQDNYIFAGIQGLINAPDLSGQYYDNDGGYLCGVYRIKLDDITNIKEQRQKLTKYQLYPNPARSIARVNLQQEGQVAITAVDLLGRSFPLWLGYASTGTLELDVSTLPTGSYTLLIDYGTKREAVRMMKE